MIKQCQLAVLLALLILLGLFSSPVYASENGKTPIDWCAIPKQDPKGNPDDEELRTDGLDGSNEQADEKTATSPPPSLEDSQFNKHPCREEILRQLDLWAPARDWKSRVSTEPGEQNHATATQKTGIWITSEIMPDGEVNLYRKSPNMTVRVSWNADSCEKQMSVTDKNLHKKKLRGTFTDHDLNKTLNKNKRGLIYAWSPHMPFSLTGWKVIKTAAGLFRIPVVPVLDPHADPAAVDESRKTHPALVKASKPMESTELIRRGMATHYPSMLVFNNRKIRSPVYPGLKSVELYEKYIKRFLK